MLLKILMEKLEGLRNRHQVKKYQLVCDLIKNPPELNSDTTVRCGQDLIKILHPSESSKTQQESPTAEP